jgi:hypothetical protein
MRLPAAAAARAERFMASSPCSTLMTRDAPGGCTSKPCACPRRRAAEPSANPCSRSPRRRTRLTAAPRRGEAGPARKARQPDRDTFYTRQAGFTLDVDYHPALGFRVVQVTPPGSACSVQIGTGLTDAAPRIGARRLPGRHRHPGRPARPHRTRRSGQRHPAQVTHRRLEGRLPARCRPGAP